MNGFVNWVKPILSHEKTAILAIVGAAAGAAGTSLVQGHVNWPVVGGAVLTAIAGLARSPIAQETTTPPSGTPARS